MCIRDRFKYSLRQAQRRHHLHLCCIRPSWIQRCLPLRYHNRQENRHQTLTDSRQHWSGERESQLWLSLYCQPELHGTLRIVGLRSVRDLQEQIWVWNGLATCDFPPLIQKKAEKETLDFSFLQTAKGVLFDKKNTPLVFTAGANVFKKPKLQASYCIFSISHESMHVSKYWFL